MTNEKKDLLSVVESSDALQKVDQCLHDIPKVFSRIEQVMEQPLKVIDDQKMNKIKTRIKELNEKVYNFGRQDSQTTRKLMTLQMMCTADSTYRILRQILAQIENRQTAIADNFAKLKENFAKMHELKQKIEQETDEVKKAKLIAKLQKQQSSFANSFAYLEGALKEVGLLQDAYEQIKKNKNIPDDWDEYDFESEEIKSHIRSAFRNGIRDFLCAGKLNMGTAEYFEQFGISPVEAVFHIRNYLELCELKMSKVRKNKDYNELPDYNDFHDFLDDMAEFYKDAYKKACNRIGIDDVLSPEFILMSARNKERLQLEDKSKTSTDSTESDTKE